MNEPALQNYISVCSRAEAPIFLLNENCTAVWSNQAAQNLTLPESCWKDWLNNSGGCSEIIEEVNKRRYFVLNQPINDSIVWISRIDLPTAQPYYELSLCKRSEKPSADTHIQQGRFPVMESAVYYAETEAVLSNDFLIGLFSSAEKLLLLNGVEIDLKIFCLGKMYLQPDCLTEAVSCLLAYVLPFYRPGEKIPVTALRNSDKLEIQIGKFDESEGILYHEKFHDHPALDAAAKAADWMFGDITTDQESEKPAVLLNILWRDAPYAFSHWDAPYDPPPDGFLSKFHSERVLMEVLSQFVRTEKIGPNTMRDDFTGYDNVGWGFLSKFPNWKSVDDCIEYILSKANQDDCEEDFDPLNNLDDLQCLRDDGYNREEKMSGLTEEQLDKINCGEPYKKDGQTAEDKDYFGAIQRIADFYGVTVEQLEIPCFMPKAVAGKLSRQQLKPGRAAVMGLLVFNELNRITDFFETPNAAYHACNHINLFGIEDAQEWEEVIQDGCKQIIDYYLMPKPVPQILADNLTLFRLHKRLTLRQVERLTGINIKKLEALESGNTSGVYCRELERLRKLYRADPFGMFISGYALVSLWNKNPLEFLTPQTRSSNEMPTLKQIEELAHPYTRLLENKIPMAILISPIFFKHQHSVLHTNKITQARELLLPSPYPAFNIHRLRIVLYLNGGYRLQVNSPVNPDGTAYIYELERAGKVGVILAAFELNGKKSKKVYADDLYNAIQILRPDKLEVTLPMYQWAEMPDFEASDGKAHSYKELQFFLSHYCGMDKDSPGFPALVFASAACLERPSYLANENTLFRAVRKAVSQNTGAIRAQVAELIDDAWYKQNEGEIPPCPIPLTVLVSRIIDAFQEWELNGNPLCIWREYKAIPEEKR